MRKNFTRALCMALMLGLAGATGCKVSIKAGTEEPVTPKPTPPPVVKPPAKKKKKLNFGKFKFKVSKDGKVELPGPILFKSGTAEILTESDAILDIVRNYLKVKTQITKLRVEGHTDTDGQLAANQKLSEARAMAVAAWLVAKGVDCKRLIAVGFGQTRLLKDPENTPEDKEANRRVDFVNAELDGKPIGGLPIDGGGGAIAGDTCQ